MQSNQIIIKNFTTPINMMLAARCYRRWCCNTKRKRNKVETFYDSDEPQPQRHITQHTAKQSNEQKWNGGEF